MSRKRINRELRLKRCITQHGKVDLYLSMQCRLQPTIDACRSARPLPAADAGSCNMMTLRGAERRWLHRLGSTCRTVLCCRKSTETEAVLQHVRDTKLLSDYRLTTADSSKLLQAAQGTVQEMTSTGAEAMLWR